MPFTRRRWIGVCAAAALGVGAAPSGLAAALDPKIRRIVALGDSITHAGGYVEILDAALAAFFPDRNVEVLDIGLPSETVSGLSEPGHAGGAFPRPDLHERLERVLTQAKPDLVTACYGMNCGIYHPLAEERFARFRDGMERLRKACHAAGAKVLHITPPVFDPLPIRDRTLPAGRDEYRQPYEGYDEVLDRYSSWLLRQRTQGWDVADAHGPMAAFIAEKRRTQPDFTLARDGVHCDATGHWLIAKALLTHLEIPGAATAASAESLLEKAGGSALLKLTHERQALLKDAWLTATGHRRPGMPKGLPLPEAQARVDALAPRIQSLVKQARG